ncbi:MAG: chloride channel protein [Clostridiales bacterium]|nr:chloride channel protein [Clostridiales bacterium]
MDNKQERLTRLAEENPIYGGIWYFIKWIVLSAVIGILAGVVGGSFGLGVSWATGVWQSRSWTLFLLPVIGVGIVFLYQIAHEGNNRGTNMVLDAVSAGGSVTPATAPLIYVSTILSHLGAASVGREGAALQIGGVLGSLTGKAVRLDPGDQKTAVMCGMSACFAAVFGTPLAATIFSMEVTEIGVMRYAAMVPCLFASLVAAAIAGRMGVAPEAFAIGETPVFGAGSFVQTVLLGLLCAGVGVFFCLILHTGGHLYQRYLKNIYLRVIAGSLIFIVLTLAFPDRLFNGSGASLIERCFEGEAVPAYAFLLKMIFTSVALGAGFRGGEIVPTLTVGATFGYLLSGILGLPSGLCASIGMAALFVSVTNCPLATLFLAFEMFGLEAMPYYAVAVAVSFAASGQEGLYSSQKFAGSRLKNG